MTIAFYPCPGGDALYPTWDKSGKPVLGLHPSKQLQEKAAELNAPIQERPLLGHDDYSEISYTLAVYDSEKQGFWYDY